MLLQGEWKSKSKYLDLRTIGGVKKLNGAYRDVVSEREREGAWEG